MVPSLPCKGERNALPTQEKHVHFALCVFDRVAYPLCPSTYDVG